MTETLEKEGTVEQEQDLAEIKAKQDEIYKKLNEELLTEEVAEMIAETVTHTYDTDDPLSRFLNDYVNTKATTEEQEKNLRLGMAVGIIAYMAMKEILDFLQKRDCARHIMNHLKVEGTMITATHGDKRAVTVLPPALIEEQKLDSDEKLIEFSKGLPPFSEFENLEGVEFKILTDDEMREELSHLKEKLLSEELGEGECQNEK